MSEIKATQIISFISNLLQPFRWCVAVMIFHATFVAIDTSLTPYILKIIINRLSESSAQDVFAVLAIPAGFYVAIPLCRESANRLYGYFVEIKMIPHLRPRISQVCFDRLLDQSHRFYQNEFAGSLVNKVNDLITSIPDILQMVLDRFLSNHLALIFAIFTLWLVNGTFALIMSIWVVLFLSVSLLLLKKLTNLSDKLSECNSFITGQMVDCLSNILAIRLFSRKNKEKSSLQHNFQSVVKAEQRFEWLYFWIWCGYGYSFVIMQGFSLYFLMKGRQQGLITVGDFALVLAMNTAVTGFLWHMAVDFTQFSKLVGKVTQALRTILLIPEIQDKADAKALVVKKGEIVFDAIRFHYKGSEPLFQNKSATIFAGEKVGLVGYSGSGKTTFVNLILRLFDVNSGRILIDGQDIRSVTQDSLREKIGMIPQDPSLFHRSLMENIRYGKLKATNEEVIEAARKAHAHDFIIDLPHGYESLVGERGVKLSGGQRQRIAIARAILKNAPILILDEATSQLDSVTEGVIQVSLWALMQGKTTIVIAHRLSTLLRMDRILVFDRGKIVEDGSHEDLLKKGGLYTTLWDAQVGGFLPEQKD
jgi:ATP-binding cassette subfamily B protein